MSLFGDIENKTEALHTIKHIEYLVMRLEAGNVSHEKPIILNEANRLSAWLQDKE